MSDGNPERATVGEVVAQLRALSETYWAIGQDFAARYRLLPSDVEALLHLMAAEERGEAVTPGSIGAAVKLTSGSVTALVDRLERAGHVVRQRDPHDRRRVIVVASKAVLAAGRAHFGGVDERSTRVLERYSDGELVAVRRFLTDMTAVATENPADGDGDGGVRRVVVGVLVRDGRALMVHRSRSRRWYPDVWDLPGGHIEEGEDPRAALGRELREELGVDAELAGEPIAHTTAENLVVDVWAVRSWSGEPANLAPDEHDDLAWLTLADLQGRALAHRDLPEQVRRALAEQD